jgi:IS5 family transposase
MPKQPAFPGLRHAMKKKRTRREKFLPEMEAVVPWALLLAPIAPHYPKVGPKGGRPPMPMETMLRVYFRQQWYALSDPMAEEMPYDSDAMRQFAGIELGCDRIPDETTILDFRHLPEKHQLTEKLFAEVNGHLADQGIALCSGTLVDGEGANAMRSREPPNSIDAPSSTKNEAKARDPEMSSTEKGNDWYFGMKAHVGVDAQSGIVHSLDTTTAKVHPFGTLLRNALSGNGQPGLGRAPAWRRDIGLGRQGLCERRARGRVLRSRHVLGRHAQGAQGWRPRSHRRRHQSDHRHGARAGRASVPGAQAAVRLSEDPLSRPGEKPGTAVRAYAVSGPHLLEIDVI